MKTIKLSNLVLTVSPDLYDLLTEVELDSYVLVERELTEFNREELNDIIARAIVFHRTNSRYH